MKEAAERLAMSLAKERELENGYLYRGKEPIADFDRRAPHLDPPSCDRECGSAFNDQEYPLRQKYQPRHRDHKAVV